MVKMWQCHMFLFLLLEILNYLSNTWHMTHDTWTFSSSFFTLCCEITVFFWNHYLHGSQLYRFCSMFLHSLYFFIFRFFFICFIFLLETLWILFMFIKLLIKWNMKYRILCIFCLFMDLVWEKLCFIDYISKVKFLLGLYFHDKDLHVRW
jgi:hypothetical protein